MIKKIGITTDFNNEKSIYEIRQNYLHSLERKNTLLILIPQNGGSITKYIQEIDALVVIGGKSDVPPDKYDESPINDTVYINRCRTDFDMELIKKFLPTKKPFLGICAGMQMLNVVCGGSLYQDIPTQIKTTIDHSDKKSMHGITVNDNTLLKKICKSETFLVNTSHHQCVKKLGKNLIINAISTSDGIIESISNPKHPFCLGVQWHPEYLNTKFDKAIFDGFIASIC